MARWKTMSKALTMLLLCGMLSAGSATTAFAYVDPTAETETTEQVPETETTEQTTEEQENQVLPEENETPNTDGNAFSVPGNGEIQDDIQDGSNKEFLTIRTKNNNTFYVIIDRSANTENVYMLSQIDENDLEGFLKEAESTDSVVTANPSIVLDEQEVEPGKPAVQETEETEQKEEERTKTGNSAGMFMILAAALCGAGAYYYFKIYKPKMEEDDDPEEGIEMSDGLVTINEDEDYDEN